ncbi:Neutral/alkaline non-lysosomal ceramidase, C-terminal [Phytophthora cactorum]|nr:Neutral/alkaline non-lysosomal ceramidase, C-terminal [Phytophthora cactorum]
MGFSLIFGLFFSIFLLIQHAQAYNIGIGKSDITGPAAKIVMMGFADSSETTAGILNRQYARAFLIEDADTNNRVMFVHCDLMAKIVNGIMEAIDAAHNSVEKGAIRWNKGEVAKALYDSSIDTTMRALHFFNDAGKLRGVLAFYPVHPTSLTGKNHLISGDNKGYAEFLLEDELDDVIVGIGIANAGDVSPNLIDNGNGHFVSAEIIGKRQYDTLSALIEGDSELIEGSTVANLSYVDFSKVKLTGINATADNPYADRTCPAVLGQNFGAGTEDGRGVGGFTEGNLKTNKLFKTMGAIIKKTPQWVQHCQNANKVPLLAVGLMEPKPWVPTILPVQIVKIGQFGIAVTNFETTTMSGRRIRRTVKEALEGAGVTEVELASVSNGYAGYMTTKEEYLTQHYEGASTLFGPNQLAAVQQELARVAASVVDASVPLDVGPTPLQMNRESLATLDTGVVFDTAPLLRSFIYVRTQPSDSYPVGSVASAVFAGAHPRNGLMLVSSFCDVQKLDSNGDYTTVMTDAHWDLRYHWERKLVSESKNTCEWNIRPGGRTSVPGKYRFVHRGYSKNLLGKLKPYTATSDMFSVAS